MGMKMVFVYDPAFEYELQREIDGLEKAGILDTLITAINKVAKTLNSEDYGKIRFVLSMNDGIADYVYDVKYKIYCRLPLYRSAAALIKHGNILIREREERFVSSIDVLNYLRQKEEEVGKEVVRLGKSKSKMAMERKQLFEKELVAIQKAITYLITP
jgi:hypothetical protein